MITIEFKNNDAMECFLNWFTSTGQQDFINRHREHGSRFDREGNKFFLVGKSMSEEINEFLGSEELREEVSGYGTSGDDEMFLGVKEKAESAGLPTI